MEEMKWQQGGGRLQMTLQNKIVSVANIVEGNLRRHNLENYDIIQFPAKGVNK